MSTKKDTSGDVAITASEVWNVLSAIDCTEHAQEKNGLTFLSWAWAWGILMSKYPQAIHTTLDDTREPDGTVTVWCEVRIDHLSHKMWLPVMDYRNQAIAHPNARAISDNRMRCMTKCLALFGLGHYIYAGEDIPSSANVVKAEESVPVKVVPPVKSEGIHIPDSDTANGVIKFMIDTANSMHSSDLESLRGFWGSNEDLIAHIKANYPQQYSELATAFKIIKDEINNRHGDAA